MIELRVRRRQGDFLLDVDVRCAGRVVGVFGPSGSGKTTLLNCIAGIASGEVSRIKVGEKVLVDSEAGIETPARRRGVGFVFQDSLLFEHMSVRGNILYGRRKERSAPAIDEIVEILELRDLLGRSPANISGGEKRRVAIARALMSGPALLLLDEPLSGLDASLAGRTLGYLSHVLESFQIPAIHVSHAMSDVLFLGHEAIVLRNGRAVAQGSPRSVLPGYATQEGETAGLYNTFHVGRCDLDEESKMMRCDIGGATILGYRSRDTTPRAPLICTVRASDIILAAGRPQGISARNIFPGIVQEIGASGERHVLSVEAGPRWLVEVSRASVEDMGLCPGKPVHLIVKATAVSFH
jgi:molybdate transport system ATP-binding protein